MPIEDIRISVIETAQFAMNPGHHYEAVARPNSILYIPETAAIEIALVGDRFIRAEPGDLIGLPNGQAHILRLPEAPRQVRVPLVPPLSAMPKGKPGAERVFAAAHPASANPIPDLVPGLMRITAQEVAAHAPLRATVSAVRELAMTRDETADAVYVRIAEAVAPGDPADAGAARAWVDVGQSGSGGGPQPVGLCRELQKIHGSDAVPVSDPAAQSHCQHPAQAPEPVNLGDCLSHRLSVGCLVHQSVPTDRGCQPGCLSPRAFSQTVISSRSLRAIRVRRGTRRWQWRCWPAVRPHKGRNRDGSPHRFAGSGRCRCRRHLPDKSWAP